MRDENEELRVNRMLSFLAMLKFQFDENQRDQFTQGKGQFWIDDSWIDGVQIELVTHVRLYTVFHRLAVRREVGGVPHLALVPSADATAQEAVRHGLPTLF